MASSWIKQLRIKSPSPETPISSLSGGNQQKVVLAKWMENQPRVFLLNEPTKGVDVGAKTEIYMQMEERVHAKISDRKLSSTHPGNYPLSGLTGGLCRHAGSA